MRERATRKLELNSKVREKRSFVLFTSLRDSYRRWRVKMYTGTPFRDPYMLKWRCSAETHAPRPSTPRAP